MVSCERYGISHAPHMCNLCWILKHKSDGYIFRFGTESPFTQCAGLNWKFAGLDQHFQRIKYGLLQKCDVLEIAGLIKKFTDLFVITKPLSEQMLDSRGWIISEALWRSPGSNFIVVHAYSQVLNCSTYWNKCTYRTDDGNSIDIPTGISVPTGHGCKNW